MKPLISSPGVWLRWLHPKTLMHGMSFVGPVVAESQPSVPGGFCGLVFFAWYYVWGRSGGCGVLTPSWAQHPLPPGSEPAGPQLHVPVHVAECALSQCCADFQTSGSGICRLPLPSCWALLRERSLCHCRRQNLTDCCRVPAPSLQCLLKLLIPQASASSLLPSVVSAVVPSREKRAEPCPAPCWKAAEPRGCTRAAG